MVLDIDFQSARTTVLIYHAIRSILYGIHGGPSDHVFVVGCIAVGGIAIFIVISWLLVQ